MKKIISVLMVILAIVVLNGCGTNKKPTVELTNIEAGRTSITYSISLDDKGIVSEDSIVMKLFDGDGNEVNSRTMVGFEKDDVTFTSLELGTKYTLKVYCTYDRKSRLVYTEDIATTTIGSEENPYHLTTVEDFENLRTDYSSDVYYILDNDIDFSDEEIAYFNGTSSKGFAGTFDGNGYTIKNATVNCSKNSYAGFFCYNKGTIKNLNFKDLKITNVKTTTATIYAGAIGYNYEGVINNVDVDGLTLELGATTVYAGAIAGHNNGGVIKKCHATNVDINVSKASVKGYIGGITGYNMQTSAGKYGKIDTCSVEGTIDIDNAKDLTYGGIVGENKEGTSIIASTSDVAATIYGRGYLYAGGIAGISWGSYDNLMATGSINYKCATVSGEDRVVSDSDTSSEVFIGGMIGSATSMTLQNCVVNMDIDMDVKLIESGRAKAGLVYGNGYSFRSKVKDCVIGGDIKITARDYVDNTISYGEIDGGGFSVSTNNAYFGGKIDFNGTITNITPTSLTVNYVIETLEFSLDNWTITENEGNIVFQRKFID